jgi:hypothetical protein
MKPLLEALMDLAARVNRLEDSAAIVREQKSAALQTRRQQLEAWIDREAEEVEQTAAGSRGAGRRRWLDTQSSVVRQFEVMRTDFDRWRAELVEGDAERSAWDAEHDALAAVTLASYCLDAAEWAMLSAELIGAAADERCRVAGPG